MHKQEHKCKYLLLIAHLFGIVNTIFVVLIFDQQSTKLFKMCKAEFPRKLFSSLNCIQNLLNDFKIHSVEVDFIYWELWQGENYHWKHWKDWKRLEMISVHFQYYIPCKNNGTPIRELKWTEKNERSVFSSNFPLDCHSISNETDAGYS